MRTFIILLLLTNLAYFGWNQGWLRQLAPPAPKTSIAAAATAVPQPFAQAAGGLTLVSELPETERAQLLLTPPVVAPRDTASLAPEAASATDSPAATVEAVALAAGGLIESDKNQLVEDAPPVEALVPWCADLGLFAELGDAEALMPTLTAMGINAALRTTSVRVSSTFWVYMPAFASDAEASRMLAELQERNIDSYYMRSGAFPGGISLGVFSRSSSAATVQEALAAQGYTAQIGEVFREEPRSTLVLSAPDAAVLETPGWADFMAKNAALTLTENVCESVASPIQFP